MPPRATRLTSPSDPQPVFGDGTGTILDRIRPIGMDLTAGIKALFFGRTATGKTTLASTFPHPILWITCSGGLSPGEIRSIDTPANRKRIKEVVPNSPAEMQPLLQFLNSPQSPFRTVVLDHASGYQDLVLKTVLGLADIPVAKVWGTASQQQYGTVTVMCKEVFRQLINLKTNVIFLASEKDFSKGGQGESESYQPSVGAGLMPELCKWLNYAVDYIGQTVIRQKTVTSEMVLNEGTPDEQRVPTIEKVPGVEYCLRVEPHAVITTKFRVPKGRVMPDYIVDPDYDKIIALIRGED